jgi:hypothetical protein
VSESMGKSVPMYQSTPYTIKRKLSREDSVERKMRLMAEMYDVLAIDPKNIKELATIDEKHFKSQIRQNIRISIHCKLSIRSISGASLPRA